MPFKRGPERDRRVNSNVLVKPRVREFIRSISGRGRNPRGPYRTPIALRQNRESRRNARDVESLAGKAAKAKRRDAHVPAFFVNSTVARVRADRGSSPKGTLLVTTLFARFFGRTLGPGVATRLTQVHDRGTFAPQSLM